MTDDRNDAPPAGRKPLTLAPRTGTVKQSFSHGRSKQVDVVIKPARRPPGAPGAPAQPAAARPQQSAAAAQPQSPQSAPKPAAPGAAPRPANGGQRPSQGSGAARAAPPQPKAPRVRAAGMRRRMEALERAKADQGRRAEAEAEAQRQRRDREDAERTKREEEERLAADLAEQERRRLEEEEAARRAIEEAPRIGTAGPVLRGLQERNAAKAAPAPQPAQQEQTPQQQQSSREGGAGRDQQQQRQGGAQQQAQPSRPLSLAEIGRVKTKPAPLTVPKAKPGKGGGERRTGRLTLDMVDRAIEGEDDKVRSIAALRRAREREKARRQDGGGDQTRVTREVTIPETISVQDLAQRMATRVGEVIKYLMRQGTIATMNTTLDADTAELIATDFGHQVKRVSESDVELGLSGAQDSEEDLKPRAPVVTVMGHVDHGKTSLLDALRNADVAAGEAGGITQHIGAYQVRLADGQSVTFLDTPGHAAFSAMRGRGAKVTDIVVLVVAGDDGVMPQTVEAINHAKAAGAPIIVAINKMDKPGANPQQVINELLQHEIVTEVNGGDVQAVEVSALKKTGLKELVEAILLQAEVLELKANPKRPAEAVVIESKLDRGRGAVATVLVQRGTLNRGDIVVAGAQWGRVRALVNERGQQLASVGPSEPAEIMGLEGAPDPGDTLVVVESESRAREVAAFRQRRKREKSAPSARASLEQLMAKAADKSIKELPIVIKADVQGSAEAIQGALEKLGTDEIRARILQAAVGAINEADVTLAKASGAPVIGFNVRASKEARELAEREGVEIRYYAIIYDVIDDIKGVMSGMLAPLQRETFLGTAEVLQVFHISKIGRVAGCRVTEGKMQRGMRIRLLRDNVVIHEGGKLNTLKRFKDDVNDVAVGQECGMSFENYQDIKERDVVECYALETVQRTL